MGSSGNSRRRRRISPATGSLLVGMGATLLVVAVYALGALRRIDDWGYDAFFRRLGGIPADRRILLVAIDDSALRRVGRWPWNRRDLAGMVDVLAELGATHIMLDMTFRTPQRVRVEPPLKRTEWLELDPNAALPEVEGYGWIIYDDLELAAAMARAGDVYLGVDFNPAGPPHPMRRTQEDSPPLEPELASAVERACEALEQDFSLDEAALRERVGWPDQAGPFPLAEVRSTAAQRICRAFLTARPAASLEELIRQVLPAHAPGTAKIAAEDLRLAYEAMAVDRGLFGSEANPSLAGLVPSGTNLATPIPVLARAMKGAGSVVFAPQPADPVLRSLPLMAIVEGRWLPHLSLRVASDVTGLPLTVRSVSASVLETQAATTPAWDARGSDGGRRDETASQTPRRAWRIPLQPDGSTLIPWAAPVTAGDEPWKRTFRLLPAGRVMELVNRLETLDANEQSRQHAISRAVRWATTLTPETWNTYAKLIDQRHRAHAAYRLATRAEDREALVWRELALKQDVAEIERRSLQTLEQARRECAEAAQQGAADPECLEIAAFEEALTEQAQQDFEALQARLRQEVNRLREELRGTVEGSVCLVGLVGTSVADFAPTPIDKQCPGVAVHAHMLNALLQHRFVQPLSRTANLWILAMLGAAATTLAARLRMLSSLLLVVAAGATLLGVSAALFRRDLTVLSWAPGWIMLVAAWIAVMAYRQATEERQRRQITRVLAQYTAPAVAAQIARRLDDGGFEPQRRMITCFFSDLGDFSAAAERLEPEQTRWLLQLYLERVSTTLIEHNALVNKFMGDGVFAFFNSPILPCADQASRACQAALVCVRAHRQAANGELRAPAAAMLQLPLRIGIATGEAAVGDFGTRLKKDYTSIGDTVNVASRLEAANKVLGTQILVDGATRAAAGERFVFRRMGRLRVAGRSGAVESFELAGTRDDAATLGRRAARFEAALNHFARRDWPAAQEELEALLREDPHDDAARFYARLIVELRAADLPADWSGEVEVAARPGAGAATVIRRPPPAGLA